MLAQKSPQSEEVHSDCGDTYIGAEDCEKLGRKAVPPHAGGEFSFFYLGWEVIRMRSGETNIWPLLPLYRNHRYRPSQSIRYALAKPFALQVPSER